MAGGTTFDLAKDQLALVAHNGIAPTDPRVMSRTNEAIQEGLSLDIPQGEANAGAPLIPVGTMAIYDIVTTGGGLLTLPAELESVIQASVTGPSAVNGQTDVTRAVTLISNSAYVDPMDIEDNGLIDLFLVPDLADPTILRRQYHYPGLADGVTVRVVGPKRYRPLIGGGDYLIIQNVPALKILIQMIERREANDKDLAEWLKLSATQLLLSEVKRHRLDVNRFATRKSQYQSDIEVYPEGSFGRTRARLALEVPGYLLRGKAELAYAVNQAVREAVDHFNYLGRTERYSVDEGPNQLEYTQAKVPADLLSYQNFEVIRLLVISQATAPTGVEAPAGMRGSADAAPTKQQAFSLIERDLQQVTDAARTSEYLALSKLPIGTKGWMVGRIGLDLPEAIVYPVSRLRTIVDRAEERGMNMGIYKGMIEEFDARVVSGHLIMPARVDAVLAASLNGRPIEIRSIFFQYMKNGPGAWDYSCEGRLDDRNEITLKDGTRRRYYRIWTHGQGMAAPTNIAQTVAAGGGATGDFGGGTITDGIFYFAGGEARLVPITGGLALEIKDGVAWVRQTTWDS